MSSTPVAPEPVLLGLHEPEARDRERVGSKAAVLATLLQAGFPVPEGFVLTADPFSNPDPTAAVRTALRQVDLLCGDIPMAVRSSAVAEDLPGASFAGQYETSLGVRGLDALEAAVRRCWASALSPGVAAYQARMGVPDRPRMAVLLQRFVPAEVAGVAFGSDPVSGDRAKVLVSAVRGVGARLVAGEADADEWEVTERAAVRRRQAEGILTAEQARAVAGLLRRIERHLGGPQDLEWAFAGGKLTILQSRPMTALPDEVTWSVPLRGGWARNIRLGEWLPEPLTPLFDTWLLEQIEERFRRCQAAEGGFLAPPPLHVLVHGWYFHSPLGSGRQTLLLRGLLRRPRLATAMVLAPRCPAAADRLLFAGLAHRWQADLLPRYQRQVDEAQQRVERASAQELVRIVDGIAGTVGECHWSMVVLGGAAWRFEVALSRFHERHLAHMVAAPGQMLLRGLAAPATPPHAVHSLDWVRPTLGELSAPPMRGPHLTVHDQHLAAERAAAETACSRALAGHPARRARFGRLLELAQRYAVLREEHSVWFTLGWPLLRRAVLRLGETLCAAGVLADREEIFFVTRAELDASLRGHAPAGLAKAVRERQTVWEQQRRLTPPLVIGRPPYLLAKLLLIAPKVLRPTAGVRAGMLRGVAASPGRATGPVRVLRDPTALGEVQPGDVLIVSAAVPALTMLYDRIAALGVDSGSVAAHASLVAREYGIPAVVGLGDATSRLTDGEIVIVDGTAGVVEFP